MVTRYRLGPAIAETGFHPLDGARFLTEQVVPKEVTPMVAWHTRAGFEAAERGLLDQLDLIAQPDPIELDALTMIDLAIGPDGSPIMHVARIAEILPTSGGPRVLRSVAVP